jgi:hypothetical protein
VAKVSGSSKTKWASASIKVGVDIKGLERSASQSYKNKIK